MSIYIHKSHNISVLIYHIVCPTKYRRVVINQPVERVLKETCLAISERYDLYFLEIGTDQDHVHFLVQSVPMMLPQRIVQTIKSITAKQIFLKVPEVKKQLWGGQFWSDGYFISTVGKHGSEQAVARYVKDQGIDQEYVTIHKSQQKLF